VRGVTIARLLSFETGAWDVELVAERIGTAEDAEDGTDMDDVEDDVEIDVVAVAVAAVDIIVSAIVVSTFSTPNCKIIAPLSQHSASLLQQ
jgi:hypothetical protein